MVFNSIHFLAFFAIILSTVLLLRRRIIPRNILLLAASYYFYGWWDWRFLGLLAGSTVVDYTCARLMSDHTPRRPADRWLLAASVAVNLGVLGFFKYYGFFIDSMAALLTSMGLQANPSTLQVILPVGISFYTFQTMGYTIDAYRGRVQAEKSLLNFALYVAFFPQLVAGPIERAARLLPQFAQPSQASWAGFYSGVYLIAAGLFKKVVLADNMAPVVESVFGQSAPDAASILLGAYAFGVQVYCDFSGYTDIARGSARCMGFELMRNFNLPFLSSNPAEFWERWHISLGQWLRDCLYIPLGGSRLGELRTHINLMIVMLLGGLWHGAGWTYVLWGAYHGVLLCGHRAAAPFMERWLNPQGPVLRRLWRLVRIVIFFHLLCGSFILFRAQDVSQTRWMFKKLMAGTVSMINQDMTSVAAVAAAGLLLLAVQLAQYFARDYYVIFRLPTPVRAVAYAAGILGFLAFGEYYGEAFIYFQF